MSEMGIYRQQRGKKGLAASQPRLSDLAADSPVFDLQN
jgi:hypothetical protein